MPVHCLSSSDAKHFLNSIEPDSTVFGLAMKAGAKCPQRSRTNRATYCDRVHINALCSGHYTTQIVMTLSADDHSRDLISLHSTINPSTHKPASILEWPTHRKNNHLFVHLSTTATYDLLIPPGLEVVKAVVLSMDTDTLHEIKGLLPVSLAADGTSGSEPGAGGSRLEVLRNEERLARGIAVRSGRRYENQFVAVTAPWVFDESAEWNTELLWRKRLTARQIPTSSPSPPPSPPSSPPASPSSAPRQARSSLIASKRTWSSREGHSAGDNVVGSYSQQQQNEQSFIHSVALASRAATSYPASSSMDNIPPLPCNPLTHMVGLTQKQSMEVWHWHAAQATGAVETTAVDSVKRHCSTIPSIRSDSVPSLDLAETTSSSYLRGELEDDAEHSDSTFDDVLRAAEIVSLATVASTDLFICSPPSTPHVQYEPSRNSPLPFLSPTDFPTLSAEPTPFQL